MTRWVMESMERALVAGGEHVRQDVGEDAHERCREEDDGVPPTVDHAQIVHGFVAEFREDVGRLEEECALQDDQQHSQDEQFAFPCVFQEGYAEHRSWEKDDEHHVEEGQRGANYRSNCKPADDEQDDTPGRGFAWMNIVKFSFTVNINDEY